MTMKMKILFLSWWWPYPPDNGSKLRAYHLIKQLSQQHEVALMAFSEPGEATPERMQALEAICTRVLTVPKPRYQPGSLRALAGLVHPWPRSLFDVYRAEVAQQVEREVRAGGYDMVITSGLQTTMYAMPLKGVLRVFEEAEVGVFRDQYVKQQSRLRRWRYQLTWMKLARYLRRVRAVFDGCAVVSAVEADYVEQAAPGSAPLAVVPNGVDVAACAADYGPPEPGTLIYPGALTYYANHDAAAWFVHAVLPRVVARRPDVVFRITGSTDGVNLNGFASASHVHLTGYLDDVRPTLARSWVCVVPLRTGGGTRLKILEAMACGVPVVSTSKGAEGLEVTPGQDILIADEPGAFAESVVGLLENADLRASLAAAGRRLVAERYDWSVVGQRLLLTLDSLMDRRRQCQKHNVLRT